MKKFFCTKFELYIDNNYKYKDDDCVVYGCDDCIYKGIDSDFDNDDKGNKDTDKLKTFLPNLNKLSNEDLYIIMNLIQKEIKRRHKENEKR